jgi:hypothetical protein
VTTEPIKPLTEDERDQMRQWLRNWQIAGPMLEQERWNRVAALTEDEAWNESESLLQAWEPDMLGDEGEGLALQQRVFARAHGKRVP